MISSAYSRGSRRHTSPAKMWIVELRLTRCGGNIVPSVPSIRLHSSSLQCCRLSSPLNRVITPSLFRSCFPVYIVIRSFRVPFFWNGKFHLTLRLLMSYIYIYIYIYMELLVKPEMLTSFIYGPTFGNAETVSFYLLHNVSTLNQCREVSCVTFLCKHFAS